MSADPSAPEGRPGAPGAGASGAGAATGGYGGQAVPEGVMMRAADRWAVAVRRPSGDIWLECHPLPETSGRARRWPLVRGAVTLVGSLRVGMAALAIAATRSERVPLTAEGEEPIEPPVGGALALAGGLFVGLFVVLPIVLAVGLDAALGGRLAGSVALDLVDAALRTALFLGYLLGVSRVAGIRRVFQYHGAEHQTIAAWEHGDALEPAAVTRYSTVHVRCGTNFLALTMLLSAVLLTAASALLRPDASAGWLATLGVALAVRLALLPLVAGLAYEGLRLGAAHGDGPLVKLVMLPGLWLQRITTQPPEPDQVEVAIRAFEAVVPAEERSGRGPRSLTSLVTVPPGGLEVSLAGATVRRPGDPAPEVSP